MRPASACVNLDFVSESHTMCFGDGGDAEGDDCSAELGAINGRPASGGCWLRAMHIWPMLRTLAPRTREMLRY